MKDYTLFRFFLRRFLQKLGYNYLSLEEMLVDRTGKLEHVILKEILTTLKTVDEKLTLLRSQRDAIEQQKCALMQRLLVGKICISAEP